MLVYISQRMRLI